MADQGASAATPLRAAQKTLLFMAPCTLSQGLVAYFSTHPQSMAYCTNTHARAGVRDGGRTGPHFKSGIKPPAARGAVAKSGGGAVEHNEHRAQHRCRAARRRGIELRPAQNAAGGLRALSTTHWSFRSTTLTRAALGQFARLGQHRTPRRRSGCAIRSRPWRPPLHHHTAGLAHLGAGSGILGTGTGKAMSYWALAAMAASRGP